MQDAGLRAFQEGKISREHYLAILAERKSKDNENGKK